MLNLEAKVMEYSWYNAILDKIKSIEADIILVIDSEELLKSQGLQEKLKDLYSTVELYQSELLLRRNLKQEQEAIIIFESGNDIPYFLLDKYPEVEVSYRDIFPQLAEEVLDWLEEKEIEELYLYYQTNDFFTQLDSRETLEFVIKTLYEVALNGNQIENIVAFLIKYFFVKSEITGAINELVGEKLVSSNYTVNINQIRERDDFFIWLEGKWKEFLINERAEIDFSDPKLRYLIDDCFEQGLMQPVDLSNEDIDLETVINEGRANYWVRSGIQNLNRLSVKQELKIEREKLEELLTGNLSIREWGIAAKIWGKISYLAYTEEMYESFISLQKRLDEKFINFVEEEYDRLVFDHRFQYAPLNNRILPHIVEEEPDKFALICFDGMSFKDWRVVKQYLTTNLDSVSLKEKFSLAMIPTVTSYSRQAIFSGELPRNNDDKYQEEKGLTQYLMNELDINKEEIYFDNCEVPTEINLLGYKAVGLIYRFIDKSAHNSLNPKLHYKSLTDILESSELAKVIMKLITNNFKIYFTSDHGNLFCKGNGVHPSRHLVDDRANRAAVYQHENLAKEIEVSNKLILNFPNIIGDDYIVTMRDRKKFGNKRPALTHGGPNIEEVIIPLIEVSK